MNIYILQHVPFEKAGFIEIWAKSKCHKTITVEFYNAFSLPEIKDVDFLVILGGPMSVNDERKFGWLRKEKRFIEGYLKVNKPVLGICLGAQLIANVLGSKIYTGKYKEIGWFDVFFKLNIEHSVKNILPEKLKVFHWHSETFDIPAGAVNFAESKAFPNQAFIYGKNAVALQFHLEMTSDSIKDILSNCEDDLQGKSPYLEDKHQILNNLELTGGTHLLMAKLLDFITT
jgi:GMP synthase (glutamine-hydrolysing)